MKTTLITGASSGIGEEFARQLAAQGENVLLVARTEAKLKTLCEELSRAHKVEAEYVAQDLAQSGAAARLFAETERRGLVIETLINNAGFGAMGDFSRLDLERALQMIDLNIKALTALAYYYLAPMRERRRGAIINVASTAAFQGVPYMAVYAATKAFVLSLSEALWEENRAYNVRVLALCPGVTETNFFEAAQSGAGRPPMRAAQTPQQVVKTALSGLARGRSHVISGWANYFMAEAERLAPRSLVERVVGKAMRPVFGVKKSNE
jgi:hypothetical protein